MFKKLTSLVVCATAFAGVTAASAQEFTLRYSQHHSSESGVYKDITLPILEYIESHSDGRIKVETYPNGVLHGSADGFKALVSDITDITPAYPIYNAGAFHLTHGLYLPGAFDSVYATIRAGEELYPEYLKPEYEAIGIELFFTASSSPYQVLTTKKVESLADLQGMKIGGSGGGINEWISAIGATPVQVSAPEMYTAFQQGLVDGVVWPIDSIESFRLQEVAKYFVPVNLGASGHLPYGINRKFWNSLPEDLQQVIYDAGRYGAVLYGDYVTAGLESGLQALRDNDVVFVELSEEDKQVVSDNLQPLWDDFIATNEAEGYPAQAFIDDMQALSEKYSGLDHDGLAELQEEEPVQDLMP